MHLVSEPTLYRLLRQLDSKQSYEILQILCSSLATLATESTAPEAEREVHQPLRTHIVTKNKNLSLFMPVSNTVSTGIKVVTASPAGIIGVINIFSPDGRLLGLLSAAEVTAFRTALASMTLFVRCKSLKKENIVVLGSGRQAEWHARLALLLVPGQIKRVTFVNRGRKRLESMKKEVFTDLQQKYPDLVVDSLSKEDTPDYDDKLKRVLAASDAIFSCTPATEPNFPYSYLSGSAQKQRLISLIGSYKPHMKEVDSETLLSGQQIYVDSKEACLEESGELISAQVKEDQLIEIGALFAREDSLEPSPISVPDGANVVFKCVGMGLMDLVVGRKLLDLAHQKGLGTDVDGF